MHYETLHAGAISSTFSVTHPYISRVVPTEKREGSTYPRRWITAKLAPPFVETAMRGLKCEPYIFTVSEFKWKRRRFILKRPVDCQWSFVDGLYVYECEFLGLHSYAESQEEANADFQEEFAEIWDCIALEDGRRLAPDARVLKKRLRGLVTSEIEV